MSKGFSTELVDFVRRQDQRRAGARLAKACFARKIPVAVAAKRLGVSRATVYMWFKDSVTPSRQHLAAIDAYIAELKT